jgi:DNA-binding response OmpR family regulator
MAKKILIIEDNKELAQLLALHLRDLYGEVVLYHDGTLGLQQAVTAEYDLVILDLMLPGVDGLEICKRLRAKESYMPILMLTAKSSELDRVLGLESGADDYVTKPFSITEVLARIKAIFRRVDAMQGGLKKQEETHIKRGEMEINLPKHCVMIRGRQIELTAREFDLLAYFARQPGRVYSREQLLDQVWGYGHDGYEHTVNSHINRLRMKIEDNPGDPEYILTVWGVGYKFSEQV